MAPRKLACTYSSGMIIEDPADLATLAVFYDEITLPSMLIRHASDPDEDTLGPARVIQSWTMHWQLLFEHGVLRRQGAVGPLLDPVGLFMDLKAVTSTCSPELFVLKSTDTSAERLSEFLVRSFFELRLPRLAALNAEQILEVREEIKDNKEGFADYVAQLTDKVDRRVRYGQSEKDAAREIVHRSLLPLYNEFRRQLAAKETGWWGRVLAAGGEFLSIDAGVLSPKFWAETLKAGGKLLEDAAELDGKDLTNKGQAFQWLAKVEKGLGR